MKTLTTTDMTLNAARKLARELTQVNNWTPAQVDAWSKARAVLVEAGQCPACLINDGEARDLSDWQPGNADDYAGRQCMTCEEFFPCGEQPEYKLDTWMGDADPGL